MSELDAGNGAAPADASPDPVIELEHVSKRFGDYVAVESADFDIAEGEFFSMLGPSGCGKTTTLRMIAGFEQPTCGRILLDGVDVSRPAALQAQRQYGVPELRALSAYVGVRQRRLWACATRRFPRQRSKSRVDGAARDRAPPRVCRARPNQLSGGQQQRIALARALVNLPKALLLDEPLGALDLKLRQAMQLELKRIQREVGITFIFVTHDQEEALTMSDRIAVMTQGRIDQIGTPTRSITSRYRLRGRLYRHRKPVACHGAMPRWRAPSRSTLQLVPIQRPVRRTQLSARDRGHAHDSARTTCT